MKTDATETWALGGLATDDLSANAQNARYQAEIFLAFDARPSVDIARLIRAAAPAVDAPVRQALYGLGTIVRNGHLAAQQGHAK